MSFPILAKSGVKEFIGGQFVPFLDHPGSIFVARKESLSEQISKVVINLLYIWPFVFQIVLVVLICGILLWAVVSKVWMMPFRRIEPCPNFAPNLFEKNRFICWFWACHSENNSRIPKFQNNMLKVLYLLTRNVFSFIRIGANLEMVPKGSSPFFIFFHF